MAFRIIARLDVKPPVLVKGIHFEGFRKIGDPREFALKYYAQGADEIAYQDVVASLYNKNSIVELVSQTAKNVFVPLSVGGGIRSVEDAKQLVRNGADKVIVNSGAVSNPTLIDEISLALGAQATTLAVEAKRTASNWFVMTNSGREHSGLLLTDWLSELKTRSLGEILISSIDFEGTKKGFDLDLISLVRESTNLPLIAHGGAGKLEDILNAHKAGADAVCLASLLHFDINTISQIKQYLYEHDVEVRLT